MTPIHDPIEEGLRRGWKVRLPTQALPERLDVDVAIVGTGAGAGITAELLTQAPGLDLEVLELFVQ